MSLMPDRLKAPLQIWHFLVGLLGTGVVSSMLVYAASIWVDQRVALRMQNYVPLEVWNRAQETDKNWRDQWTKERADKLQNVQEEVQKITANLSALTTSFNASQLASAFSQGEMKQQLTGIQTKLDIHLQQPPKP